MGPHVVFRVRRGNLDAQQAPRTPCEDTAGGPATHEPRRNQADVPTPGSWTLASRTVRTYISVAEVTVPWYFVGRPQQTTAEGKDSK